MELSREVFDNEKSEQISKLQTKYETEKLAREKEIAQNKAIVAESESQKNLILFIASAVIAFLIVLVSVFYYIKLKQTKKAEIIKIELKASQKQLALEKQYRDSELKALKAQMNPHFIFNVLNSIQEFIVLNQKEQASDYLAMFAELIRSYLHFSNTGNISLREEIDSLQKYLELETLRFEDTFNYSLNYDDNLNSEELKIPTMIIQPYVENAIQHGLFHKKNNRKLSIDFSMPENKVINCTITDNGIGREKAKAIKLSKPAMHKSFAMEATASRLELYNQKFTNKIGIETIDLFNNDQHASGTKVVLSIPII